MITLKQVSKKYPMKDYVVHALDDVSLSIEDRGFVSIVGPSGCGKTTLLNLLGGLDHPSSGSITLDDIDTNDYDDSQWNSYRNQQVGFVFQSFYLIPHLNILENVMLPLKLAGKSIHEQQQRAAKLLEKVGLKDKLIHLPSQLSGGQQQRVAIARALVLEPKIILADEPTGSLDQRTSLEIMELLQEISQTRLVLMVTHHTALARQYANRMVFIEDGKIVDDQLIKPLNDVSVSPREHVLEQSKMSFVTACRLSYLNLKKRLYRTLLMVLAASIGIMGMTLVLAVASGFDQFLSLRKSETLNAFPIRVEKIGVVVPFFDEKYQPNLPAFAEDSVAYPRNIQYEFQTMNTLTPEYYAHVQGLDQHLYTHIHYDFGTKQHFGLWNDGVFYQPESVIQELEINFTYLNENFDLLSGSFPQDDQMEAVIVLDRYNRLSKDIAQSLGYTGDSPISFTSLLGLDLKWLPNDLVYTPSGTVFMKKPLVNVMNDPESSKIPVVGVVRIKEKFNLDYLRSGLYYNEFTGQMLRENAAQSLIVEAQLLSQTSVLDGSSLSHTQRENLLRDLGYAAYPIGYTIYSSNFDHKDLIMSYLRSYNDQVSINEAIEPLDIAGIGLSTMRVAIDSMTIILLVFSGISLLISNLMIGIMTYTSVIERTKEIGILRSIGARKRDVGYIFYAETLFIGFFSGVFGVVMSYSLMPLLNLFLKQITSIPSLTRLHPLLGIGLILMSTLLTSLSGIIPAHIASNKDPILCLRNE
jgi:putative ABC transport system permease protein